MNRPSPAATRPPRRRSLRTQLIFWNSVTLLVLLAALGGFLRYTMITRMVASIDHDLEHRAQHALENPPPFARPQPEEYGTEESADTREPPPPPRLAEGGLRPGFFDAEGRNMDAQDRHALWDTQGFALAKRGQEVSFTVESAEGPLRIFSRPLPPDGPVSGVLQIPYPLSEVRRAALELNHTLLLMAPIALLASALGGAALTDRVLRRVRHLSKTAGHISAQNFAQRLPVQGNDEFSELAETFNGMLGRLETAFRQQERLVALQRRFTADASHELKTPLTIIKGNTSLTLSGDAPKEVYHEAMQEIDQAANSMSHLVQDLLLLARADEGKLSRQRVRLPIREMLERAAASLRAPENAPIHLELPDPTWSVLGDQGELVRVFMNLLENAVRYTPPEGRITITVRRNAATLLVTVADTGIGIAPEHLPHLCERFYRVSASRSRPDGGAGLGLAICKSLLEAHDGTLTLESVVGVGTAVHVSLPLADAF